MRRKLLITYCILIIVAISTSLISYGRSSYTYLKKQNKEKNLQCARLLKDLFEDSDYHEASQQEAFVSKYSREYEVRITLIRSDGEVTADSLNEVLENHANREEVARALNGEETIVERYSRTLQTDCMYVAVPVHATTFDGVIRVCVTMENIQVLEETIVKNFVASTLIGVCLAFLGAYLFSKMISKPIEEVTKAAQSISKGQYDIKIYTREKTQIGALADSFNIMSYNMKTTIGKLTRRNSELEAIIGSMGAGVVAIDDSNNILFVNQEFLRMFEVKPKFTEGRALYNVIREKCIFQVIEEVRENNESVNLTEDIFKPKEMKLRMTGSPLVMENGTVFGVLLILNDITHIYKLESMRRDFVSNVTHELKTPLTSIHGFVDTLRHGAIEDPNVAQHFLEIIDIETERLSSLINDILTLSEIEAKRDYDCTQYQLCEGVQLVVELLQGHTGDQVTLTYECEDDLPSLTCNPERIRQLMINLIENAIKYTEEGNVHVTLKQEDQFLVLRVKDTGIGIPEDQIDRIFERFYRVDKGRSRRQGGTGLGLSIVKHIVELYHGQIQVESKVNVGSEFTVRFPVTVQS